MCIICDYFEYQTLYVTLHMFTELNNSRLDQKMLNLIIANPVFQTTANPNTKNQYCTGGCDICYSHIFFSKKVFEFKRKLCHL